MRKRSWLAKFKAIFAKKVGVEETGPPVKFIPRGGATETEKNDILLEVQQSPGFLFTQEILADALSHGVDAIMLDYTQQGVVIMHQMDGVWHPSETRDRQGGDLALAVMKKLANLNINERRVRQDGTFGVDFERAKQTAKLTSQGVPTGERVLLQLEGKSAPLTTLDELGMRPKMQQQLRAALNEERGMVVFSAPPANGLSTTFEVALQSLDRFVRDFVAIEDKQKREREVLNVPVKTYDGAAGQSPATMLPEVIRSYPNAIVVRDLVNSETLSILCQQVGEGRLMITGINAKECAEALLRLLALEAPPAKVADVITAVLNQRLVRKLCDQCKQAYTPTPEVLKQLGVPAGRVSTLYREFKFEPQRPNEQAPPPCEHCRGIGYRGRTAIFEFLPVTDEVRQRLAPGAAPETLRAVARKAGMRTIQEEGLSLVAQGITSLPELMRVMKQ